jgi:hypothetical protein
MDTEERSHNIMNKKFGIAVVSVVAILVTVSGCKAEPVTTTVTEIKTITPAAQTITTTATAQTITVTSTSMITITASQSTTSSTIVSQSTTTSNTVAPLSHYTNDQPQQITSEDGKIQIVSHFFNNEKGVGADPIWGSGGMVTAEITNLSTEDVLFVVAADMFDKDGELTDTIEAQKIIEAGKTITVKLSSKVNMPVDYEIYFIE